MINNYCSQYKTFSMPPGGCETEKILWYHREMVLDSRKSGFTNLSTSGFLRKMGKWPKKYWLKEKKAEKDWLASWSLWVWLRAIQNVWFMHLQLFQPYPVSSPYPNVRQNDRQLWPILTERNPSRLAGLVFQEFKSKSLLTNPRSLDVKILNPLPLSRT